MKKSIIILIIILVASTLCGITIKQAKSEYKQAKEMTEDFSSSIMWNGSSKLVTIYAKQLEEMKARGYDNTKILDLLFLKSMECNSYTSCIGHYGQDIGPFQINYIHKEQFKKSLELHNEGKFGELFLYQLSYADSLVSSYMDSYCGQEQFKSVGKEFTNKARVKCVAVSYNGSPRYKETYANIGWEKRKAISDFLFGNGFLVN